MFRLLEGKNVNLRVMEKDDLPLIADWFSDPEVLGEYNPFLQMSRTDLEKAQEHSPFERQLFIIEKKDGTKIGFVSQFYTLRPGAKHQEIGFVLIPSERGKGYSTEAVEIMVDFLFLSKEIVRIQAQTDQRNAASQKVLEKVGFTKEGTVRKFFFMRGEWRDAYLYSILREEWKEPKILTKTV